MSFDCSHLPRHTPRVSLITAPQHDLKGTGRYFATMTLEKRRPLLSEIGPGGRVHWTAVGHCVNEHIHELTTHYPIAIDRLALMPDHLHLCFRVTDQLQRSILRILSDCRCFAQKAAGFDATEHRLWDPNYHLFVAFNRAAYTRCIDYTAGNPKRWWMTHEHDYNLTPQIITHPSLPLLYTWQAIGNLNLLDTPLLFPIVIHRRDTPEQIAHLKQQARLAIQAGGTIVGGFISPTEKKLLKELYAEAPNLRLISLLPHTLNNYKPPATALKAFNHGQRLLLTSVPDHPADRPCARDICLRHNTIAQQLAEASTGLKCF